MLDRQSAARPSLFSLSEADIERRKTIVDLSGEDISRIATLKDVVSQEGDRYTEDFFRYLTSSAKRQPCSAGAMHSAEAKRRERNISALTIAVYDRAYVEQRVALALLYSRADSRPGPFWGHSITCWERSAMTS